MSRFRRDRLSVRAQQWGQFIVIAVRGELKATNIQKLMDCVLEVQGAQPVILDLWDMPRCDPDGIAAVREIKHVLEDQAWAFAVVADPNRQCAQALESGSDPVTTYPDRRTARGALHHAAL
jgi:hypothetical protein